MVLLNISGRLIGPFEIIEINDKQCKIRDVDNESNIQITNFRFIKPYKVSPYMHILNTCMIMMTKEDRKDVRDYERIIGYIHKKCCD